MSNPGVSLAEFRPASDGSELTHKTWPDWLERFENIMTWHSISGNDKDARQVALLFATGGPELQRIFKQNIHLRTSTTGDPTFTEITTILTTVFNKTKNTYRDELEFRRIGQTTGESFDHYLSRLRSAADTISFEEPNQSAKDRQVILQAMAMTNNNSIRQALLREASLTINLVSTLGLAIERSQLWAPDNAVKQEAAVSAVQRSRGATRGRRGRGGFQPRNVQQRRESTSTAQQDSTSTDTLCAYCGYEQHKAGRSTCPASQQECYNCGRIGHFGQVCRSRRDGARAVETEAGTDDEPQANAIRLFAVNGNQVSRPEITIEMNSVPLQVMIDSGADVTIISSDAYRAIGRPMLQPSKRSLKGFGSAVALPILGSCNLPLQKRDVKISTEVFVLSGSSRNLLGCNDAIRLGVLSLDLSAVERGDDFDVREKFPTFFGGLGRFKGEMVTFLVNKQIPPTAITNRRIPFHLRPKVEEEIERLVKLDIIERTDTPSPWVSPIVVVPKPDGRIRMCVDSRKPNEAIVRKIVMMPTMEDLLITFNGCKWFSKIDLNDGYHQLVLSPGARGLTTFATHNGLFRYKRLSFGINAAAEIFQEQLERILPRRPGIRNVVDDILIGGQTKEEHNERLWAVLKALTTNGFTGSEIKCVFFVQEVVFFGHVFSAEGVRPEPRRATHLRELKTPGDAGELRSLLGMVGYCSRFIPGLAAMLVPLRVKQDSFEWTDVMAESWRQILEALERAPTLGFFDAKMKTAIITDAGPEAVAGILVQFAANGEQLIRGYFSKTLSTTERKYPQIDREMVGVVSTILHFWVYLVGKPFTVFTDHMPLVQLMNKSGSELPARVERLFLKIQGCECKWIHIDGRSNPADYLSRHPVNQDTYNELSNIEFSIDSIANDARPLSWTEEALIAEIEKDEQLVELREILTTKKDPVEALRNHPTLKDFREIANTITVTQKGILLKHNLIIVPTSLQQEVLTLAHEGHQGISKTKALLRSKVWFRGIDGAVERLIKSCTACVLVTNERHKNPITTTEIPPGPWRWLSVDYTTISSSEYFLVIEDIFSKFPLMFRVRSTDFPTFRRCFEQATALFGLPEKVFSDNGPPYNSEVFAAYLQSKNIYHRKSIPVWPSANGQVERLMTSINKVIRTALLENRNINEAIETFLKVHRNTPHSTTNRTPAEAMFSFVPRLELTMPGLQPDKITDTTNEHALRIQRFTEMANRGRSWKRAPKFGTGELVFVKQHQRAKFDPIYDPKPFQVQKSEGQRLFLSRDGVQRQRNVQEVKRAPPGTQMLHSAKELWPAPQQVINARAQFKQTTEKAVVPTPDRVVQNSSGGERVRIDYIPNPPQQPIPHQPMPQQPMLQQQMPQQQTPQPEVHRSDRVNKGKPAQRYSP